MRTLLTIHNTLQSDNEKKTLEKKNGGEKKIIISPTQNQHIWRNTTLNPSTQYFTRFLKKVGDHKFSHNTKVFGPPMTALGP